MKIFGILIPMLLAMTLITNRCTKIPLYKVSTTLPPATQEGKNTFGFTLNGSLWLPNSQKFSVPSITAAFNEIDASRGNQNFSLYLGLILSTGTYDLTDTGRDVQFYDGTTNYKSTEGSCQVTRLDTQTGIISGTFTAKAVNASGTVISIENGRFDLTRGVH